MRQIFIAKYPPIEFKEYFFQFYVSYLNYQNEKS